MVIQRWQSVLLFIVALVMTCFTFMSIGQVQFSGHSLDFTTLGFSYDSEMTDPTRSGYVFHTWTFFIVSLLSAILPLINIFLFKNLKLQKNICLMEILFLIAVAATGCTYGYYYFAESQVTWSYMIAAPFIALVADILALNRICRDKRILRSADRLR